MNLEKSRRSGKSATARTYMQRHSTPTADKCQQWVDWCDANGVVPVSLTNGEWVRTNAPDKCYKNKALAVKLKYDCIHVVNHVTGERWTFFDNDKPRTPTQLHQSNVDRQIQKHAREAERQAQKSKTAQVAHQLLAESVEMAVSGYLADKGLSSTHGIRWHHRQRCWCIPMTDIDGTVYGAQRIYNDKRDGNNKRFLAGTRVPGLMYVLGELPGQLQVIVCEGFATAATIREETGGPVVCAFTAENLLPVCEVIRATYPDIGIIVAGDDDRRNEYNTGRIKAADAALAVVGRVAYPTFHGDCTSCVDFNDVHNCKLCRGDV